MICVVGGGLAGLVVANRLGNCVVFEAANKPGGLLRSERINGFTFDTGGSHIIFSRKSEIVREMLQMVGDYVMHRRRTFIFYNNRFIKYPFENGISMLPPYERFAILKDFVENLTRSKGDPENLLDWFYHVFGREITERYLRPYNEKIWKMDLTEISLEWVGGRVPTPPVEDVLKSAVGIDTEGYTHQIRFYYPLEGGIERLAMGLAENVDIRLGERVVKMVAEDGAVVVNDQVFERAIYTAPLTYLPEIMNCREIEKEIKKLEYNSLTVVGLGVRGRVPNFHWIYFPQREIVFHRVAFLSNYSPKMAPEGRSTIIAEISRRPGEKLRNIEDRVINDLSEVGFELDVEVCEKWEWEHAYVVYNHDYRSATEKIRSYLAERGIIPFGRFGRWEYLNMDAVVEKARKVVEAL